MDDTKLAALAKAARALNQAGIVWGVGASAMLYLLGVAEEFNDFDLLIATEQSDAARAVFERLGARALPAAPPSGAYDTEVFLEYRLDGVDFDLLCGFAIRRKEAVYRYPFGRDRIAEWVSVAGERAPLCPLEDWFVLYQLMPGRQKRATLIGRYLKANPREDSCAWLNRWLANRLPGDVRERVMTLYSELGKKNRLTR